MVVVRSCAPKREGRGVAVTAQALRRRQMVAPRRLDFLGRWSSRIQERLVQLTV